MPDLTVILLAACAVLGVLAVIMTGLYIRARIAARGLQERLDRQLDRVEARRKKILQLRKVIALLAQEVRRDRALLRSRPGEDEMREYYGRISDALLRIYQRTGTGDARASRLNSSEFCMLSEQLSSAFGVKNDRSMPWYRDTAAHTAPGEVKAINAVRYALVVDDNRRASNALCRILARCGCRTETASSGEQALEMFMHSPDGHYSFVFMDLVLSGMNGYDTAHEIRQLRRFDSERIPIIAVTANDFAEDLLRMQGAGMNDRVLKPVEEDAVRAVLNKWKNEDAEAAHDLRADAPYESADAAEEEKTDDTWVSLAPPKPTVRAVRKPAPADRSESGPVTRAN